MLNNKRSFSRIFLDYLLAIAVTMGMSFLVFELFGFYAGIVTSVVMSVIVWTMLADKMA